MVKEKTIVLSRKLIYVLKQIKDSNILVVLKNLPV